jgi:hypothetical protein
MIQQVSSLPSLLSLFLKSMKVKGEKEGGSEGAHGCLGARIGNQGDRATGLRQPSLGAQP